jgi:hypothetical protein
MEQHRTFSYDKKTYYHINGCPVSVKKLREFQEIHFTANLAVPNPGQLKTPRILEHLPQKVKICARRLVLSGSSLKLIKS